MYRGHTVGVTIPAYNEERFVGDVLESVPGFVDRVYAVDDGSSDGTWGEIRRSAERINAAGAPGGPFERRVVPLRHERNRGVGGAIKTGYLEARADGIDVTVVMGGDGQMEPEMLDRLVDPIVEGRADYTKGNRFLNRAGRESMPAFRFVGNTVLAALTKVASGYWRCGDPQSGYTAISLRALERVDVEGMYEFYGYCNDLLVKLNVAGLPVMDVPRPITYGEEESDIAYTSYVPRVSWMLFRNFWWRLKTNYIVFDFHPLVLAYAAGGVSLLSGFGLFGAALLAGGGALAGGLALAAFALALLAFAGAMAMDMAENEPLSRRETVESVRRRATAVSRSAGRTGPVATADGGTDATGEADPRRVDDALALLADRYRRYALVELRETSAPLSIDALAERVVERLEREGAADEETPTAQGVSAALYHVHLTKLRNVGAVDDAADGAVRYAADPRLDGWVERAARER